MLNEDFSSIDEAMNALKEDMISDLADSISGHSKFIESVSESAE